jgi:mRNA-degrading endonuclease RelE of RelBE toxin-antitoxin system
MLLEFIELSSFDEVRDSLFSDDDFLSLQRFLCENPEAGDLIQHTHGCRKLRWAAKGKGKRGGSRVIYFIRTSATQIVLVTAYGKGERDDVPRKWLKRIKEAFDHEQS